MTTMTIWQRTNSKDGALAAIISKKLGYTLEIKDPRTAEGAPESREMPIFVVDGTEYKDLKALITGLNFDMRTL